MTEVEDKTSGEAELPKTFGYWLKKQRLEKKVSLEEVAAVTKIHLHQLKCLEEGWPDTVPALAIVRGITVSYAKYLGLNEAEVIEQFKQHQSEFKEKASSLVKVETPPAAYSPQSGKPLRFGSYSERKEQSKLTHWISTKRTMYAVIAVLAFGLLFFLMSLGKKANQEVPLSPADSASVNLPQPQVTQIVDAKPADAASLFSGNPPFEFSITATGDVWFNMQIDEQSLVSFKLSAGQSRKVTFNRKARVTFSNPLATRFQIAGVNYKSTAPLGKDETLIFPEQSSQLVIADKPSAPAATQEAPMSP